MNTVIQPNEDIQCPGPAQQTESQGAKNYKLVMALVFSGIFHSLSLLLILISIFNFFSTVFHPDGDVISAAIKSINTMIISLAMFELGVGVSKEYVPCSGEENIFFNIRRTITRFVGTVCIALVLEALIMIIKYSQLELAGNLFYPVGIVAGSSVLLSSLGLFLWLTRGHTE